MNSMETMPMELGVEENEHEDERVFLPDDQKAQEQNIFRRHIRDNPRTKQLARHKLWLDNIQHEYPMPYVPYRIGVYIRYYNQTKYFLILLKVHLLVF